MQTFRQHNIHPGVFIGLAISILILPLPWLFAFIIAAAFHEACHLLALKLCGGQLYGIHIGTVGAVIHAAPLSPGKAMFCSLAGPIGGFLLIFLARQFPRLAFCSAVQSVYNLLPLTGLDGGHALGHCMGLFFACDTPRKICRITELVLLSLLSLFCLYCTYILHLGPLPILMAGNLVIKGVRGKIPCKT